MSNQSKKKMNLNVIAKTVIVLGVIVLLGSVYVLNNPQLTKPRN